MSGKGSTPRPFDIPHAEYASNHARIFGERKKKQEEPVPPFAAPAWRPISEAPRDGTHFWYLQPIIVASTTAPPRIQYHAMEVWRKRTSPETDGYWTNYATSIPDHAMRAGWFLLCDGGEVDAARICRAQRTDKE